MKKNITKKMLAAFAVAMLFTGLSQAQYFGDYVEAVTGGVEEIDTVTLGTQTGLYAEPDPYFSPSYNPSDNTGLGLNQFWSWSISATTGSASASEAVTYRLTPAEIADTSNYIEYIWGNGTGTVTIEVTERNGAFSCTGAAQSIVVEVIDTSAVAFAADNVGAGIIGTDISVCESALTRLDDIVRLTFTNNDLPNNPSFQAQYRITVDTIQADATVSPIAARTETFLGSGGDQVTSNSALLDLAQPTGGFVCIQNAGGDKRSTVYTYRLVGVNDRISRKSEYLVDYGIGVAVADYTGWNWYDTAEKTISVTVNPTPITGPIYHISNMWAN